MAAEDDHDPPPPPPKSGSGRFKGRHKTGSKDTKNLRLCKACQQKKPEADFAVNQAVDMECKKYLYSIAKQSRAQGPEAVAWYQQTRNDPVKCRKMIESYKAAYKTWVANGKQGKLKWSVVQYRESLSAESGTRTSENQQMMWEKQAIKFWQSVDGGCYTEEEAEQKWKTMEALSKTGEVLSDKKGPEKKPLRLAITREDMVYNYNDVSKKRSLEFSDKPQKKMDDAALAKSVRRVLSSHENIASSSTGASVMPEGNQLTQMMLQGGAGHAFEGATLKIGQVQNLVPDSSEDEPTQTPSKKTKREDERAGDGDEPDDSKDSKDNVDRKGSETKWFDKDRAINAAQKTLAAQEKKVLDLHKQRVEELKSALEMIAGLSAEDKAHFAGEEKIASVRLRFMQAVDDQANVLEDLIEKFQAPISPTKIEVSETALMAGVVALGNSPACKMFAELRLLAELSVCKDEVLGCNTMDEINEHKKAFAKLKAPFLDLLGSAQAGRFVRGIVFVVLFG